MSYSAELVREYEQEIASLREYIDLLENQVIVMMAEDEPRPTPGLDALFAGPAYWADRPVPFLPVDPEEQRRRDATAADGSRAMIYRERQS